MEILNTVWLDDRDYGARRTPWKHQDWPMAQMHININQTWKLDGKPTWIKCAHEKFYRKISGYAKYLRNLGEIGVVHSISTVKEKQKDQEKMCMLLGYAQNYTGGTYCIFNLRTKYIVLICDIMWINKPYQYYI